MKAFRPRVLIAALLACLLAAEALAMPLAEASLWADRYSAARRPAPPRAPFPALETAPDVLSATLHLVESLGPPSAPVRVRLIQDIHRHAQAQRFISEAIGAMASGDDRSLVAVEGAWTATDVSPFREPDLAAVLRPMADALLERNALSGAAHAALLGRGPSTFYGIDDAALHATNVDSYRRSLRGRAAAEAALTRLAEKDATVAAGWSSGLRAESAAAAAFARGDVSLGDHATRLARSGSAGPTLKRYLAALAAEREVRIDAVRRERLELLSGLTERLSEAELRALVADAAALRLGKMDDRAYHEKLLERARSLGWGADRFPALAAYVRYQRDCAAIDAAELFDDLDRAEVAALRRAARTPASAEAALAVRDHQLLSKLAVFALTPAEWTRVSRRWPALDAPVAAALGDAADFYRLSEERDAAMAGRLLDAIRETGATSVTVVAGGFHSPGLSRRLAAAGLHVEIHRPRLTSVPADGSAYLTEFARERTPLERLVEGDALFLASPPLPQATRFELGNRAAAWLRVRMRWSLDRLKPWFAGATGWALSSIDSTPAGAGVNSYRYTDREVVLRVVVPVAQPDGPITVEPVRSWRRPFVVASFVLFPVIFSTFGVFLIPLALVAAANFLWSPMSPAQLSSLKLVFGLVLLTETSVSLLAFAQLLLVGIAALAVLARDRFRSAASLNKALERSAEAALVKVQRSAKRDPELGQALALVHGLGYVDDDGAVLQGGKLLRKHGGSVERIILLLRLMRYSPAVTRYVIVRRALGFRFDALAADIGADGDPLFAWNKRLFWELYADVALLRRGWLFPSTVPYTIVHFISWGTAALVGIATLFLITVVREGRRGAVRSLRVWRALFSLYAFREHLPAWVPDNPPPSFPRRSFEALASAFVISGGLLIALAAMRTLNISVDQTFTAVVFLGTFLLLNLMNVVAYGRLIQENSNAYRPPGDGPTPEGPRVDTPEEIAQAISEAANAIAERRAAGGALDAVAGDVVLQGLGTSFTSAPGRRAFNAEERARVLAALRVARGGAAPLSSAAAAFLARAVTPDAPEGDAGSKTLRFVLRAGDLSDFAAWLRLAPAGRRIAVIADEEAALGLAAFDAALRRRFTVTTEDVFVEGHASAAALERALAVLGESGVQDSVLVLPPGVGLLADAEDDVLTLLRQLVFLRFEEVLSSGALRPAPVGFLLDVARLLATQA